MRRFFVAIFLLLLLAACNDSPAGAPSATGNAGVTGTDPAATTAPTRPEVPPTATPIPPTPTPEEPLAATVNGRPITLATFEETLARREQGVAATAAADAADPARVLDMLIERELIAQAAAATGITVTEEMVDAQVAESRRIAEEAGGDGSFAAWLAANQMTPEAFREELRMEMLAAQVAEAVTADVPQAVKQVNARYIQVNDPALAQSLLAQIRDGADFSALAQAHSLDRATAADGGELGYFPAGTLLVPEIEEAAFALEPGEVSDVITGTTADGSQTTYYIVQVVDVDPQRPLSPEVRARLLQERFAAWLAEQWSQAEIVRLVETNT